MPTDRYRRPVSVLVVVHTDDGQALLLKRKQPFEFWQPVTGSLHEGETHAEAAARELREETGLTDEGALEYTGTSRQFAIDPRWLHRFQPGIVENVEFEYRYRLPAAMDIRLADDEHSQFRWLPAAEAADLAWSWTNREALLNLTLQ